MSEKLHNGSAHRDEDCCISEQPASYTPLESALDDEKHDRIGRSIIGITADELDRKSFPPLEYIVPSLITEGVTLLAGRIKLGKSWMAMDLALAVASGDAAFGDIECEQGDVLYLALEDNERRLQSRQKKLLGSAPKPNRLEFNVKWPRLDERGLEEIEAWINSAERPRLVIIDTLKMVRRQQRGGEGVYEYDYSTIEPLRDLANQYGIAIVVVHHLNKRRDSDDPFDAVSGSNGLAACADATLILDRNSNGTTFYGRGRDIQEFEKAMAFDKLTGRWSILGEAAEVHRSDEREKIISALSASPEPIGPTEISEATGMRNNNVRNLLGQMVRAGEVEKPSRGKYVLALSYPR